MKYIGELKYPKIGDVIKVKGQGDCTISKLEYDGLSQGDLVTGYEKGLHVVVGFYKEGFYYFPILKKVYTDKLQPKLGAYTSCCPSICEPADIFLKKEKEKIDKALKVINQYYRQEEMMMKIKK